MPRFSVIVPTASRPRALAQLLDRLDPDHQWLQKGDYDVVVGDDSEGDGTRRLLSESFPWVTYVQGPRRGPAANRNAAARAASGEWLVFTDDDCQPTAGWLCAIERRIGSEPLDVIEGRIVAPDRRESIFRRDVENLKGDCYWSANLAIRRSYFEQIGGFDEDFGEAGGEDLELAHRFRTLGARRAFCAEALVVHPSHVMTWRQVLAWAFRMRWHVLYRLKTRQAPGAGAPAWKAAPALIAAEGLRLLRTTWKAICSIHGWSSAPVLARTALEWALFPIVLPYLLYWDFRFRKAGLAK